MIKYTKEHIERLLSRFMDGTSTLEEEEVLSQYFLTAEELPEEWLPYRDMFVHFEDMAEESNPIPAAAEAEDLPDEAKTSANTFLKYKNIAAAALVLLISIAGIKMLNKQDAQPLVADNEQSLNKDSATNAIPATTSLSSQAVPEVVEVQLNDAQGEPKLLAKEKKTEPKQTPRGSQRNSNTPKQANIYTAEDTLQTLRKLHEENAMLRAQLDSIRQKINQMHEQIFITEMEAHGYQAIYQEDGNIEFVSKDSQPEPIEL